MRQIIPIRSQRVLTAVAVLATAMFWLANAGTVSAGIIAPQQFAFSADDLASSLNAGAGAGAASTSPSRGDSQGRPLTNGDQPTDPLSWVDSHLPVGSTSSSTSTSSSGGVGSGPVVCVLQSRITLRDDSPLGQLAEDHGLSLPDPPGTDLLRPPRAA
jgi:hypothetical protein